MSGSSSLISRFAASTAVLAAAIVVLAFFAFQTLRGDFVRQSFESPLDEWSAFLAGHIGQDPELARVAARNHQMGVVLKTSEGVFAFRSDGEATTPEHLARHHSNARRIIVAGHGNTEYAFYLRDDEPAAAGGVALWGFIGGLLFLVGVVYVVQLSQLRPLRWLKEGVDKVSEGDLSTRVPVVRMDEIGQVGRAFNHMTGRVEQMLDDHDRLLADVSHELRSPLARIKVALELLPAGEKRDQIAADVCEMEALTSTLLERERIKNRTAQPQREDVDLLAIARNVVAGFTGSRPDVTLGSPQNVLPVKADAALLRVLLQNVIDNAVKFSRDDSGPVTVELQQRKGVVEVIVDDDGIGIPENMTSRVMEPFVKLDPSRGHRSGYGLGLNLCQRIVQAHDGEIRIERRQPRGTRVSLRLPAGADTNKSGGKQPSQHR